MSDKDSLPGAGIPFFSVVDENGVSTDGTSASMRLIRSRGMDPICEVSSAGVATSGSTLATLRQRGIQFYCPVTENGVTSDAVSMTTLRYRGIPFFCPVGTNGVATGGTATIGQLAGKGIPYACILDSLGGAGGSPEVPAAPVLTWTSGVTDTTPVFDVDLPSGLGAPDDAETGDIIYLEITDNADFDTESTDTLDAGDVSGDIVEMEQGTPLADGTYYARARLRRGASYGPYSNTETKTIDATAPTITSSNSVSLPENDALSHTLTANEAVTWTKTGGADTALFTLVGSNLSMAAKDYEDPEDADTNNTYVVQVTATDTAGNATNQTITVTVTDVADSTSREFAIGAPAYINSTAARSYATAFGYITEL